LGFVVDKHVLRLFYFRWSVCWNFTFEDNKVTS